MRLIDARTLEFAVYNGAAIPPYAVLSHRWNRDEVTFADYADAAAQNGNRFRKIRHLCSRALADDLNFAWIDTCCIDKTNSVELSEAINSMFTWYMDSAICYVFLADYHGPQGLGQCEWFTRGWTLQELVAPDQVHFYDDRMAYLGSRDTLQPEIHVITGIASEYMGSTNDYSEKTPNVRKASVARRMSWASSRVTERAEDVAYCLLGIFDINIPMMYGEGGVNAFSRLQRAIIAQSDDESLFAWASELDGVRGMFARHPREFQNAKDIIPRPFLLRRPPIIMTNQGLEVHRLPRSLLRRIIVPGAKGSADEDPILTLQCVENRPGQALRRLAIRVVKTREGTWARTATSRLESHYLEDGFVDAIYPGGWVKTYIAAKYSPTEAVDLIPHVSVRGVVAQAVDTGFLMLWSLAAFSWSYRDQGHLVGPQEAMQSCLLLMIGWKWTGLSYLYLWITFLATTMPGYVMDKLPAWWFPRRAVWGTPLLSVFHDASRWTVMLGVGLATVYEMRIRGLFAR